MFSRTILIDIESFKIIMNISINSKEVPNFEKCNDKCVY